MKSAVNIVQKPIVRQIYNSDNKISEQKMSLSSHQYRLGLKKINITSKINEMNTPNHLKTPIIQNIKWQLSNLKSQVNKLIGNTSQCDTQISIKSSLTETDYKGFLEFKSKPQKKQERTPLHWQKTIKKKAKEVKPVIEFGLTQESTTSIQIQHLKFELVVAQQRQKQLKETIISLKKTIENQKNIYQINKSKDQYKINQLLQQLEYNKKQLVKEKKEYQKKQQKLQRQVNLLKQDIQIKDKLLKIKYQEKDKLQAKIQYLTQQQYSNAKIIQDNTHIITQLRVEIQELKNLNIKLENNITYQKQQNISQFQQIQQKNNIKKIQQKNLINQQRGIKGIQNLQFENLQKQKILMQMKQKDGIIHHMQQQLNYLRFQLNHMEQLKNIIGIFQRTNYDLNEEIIKLGLLQINSKYNNDHLL